MSTECLCSKKRRKPIIKICGVIWDRWGKMRQFGCQIWGNLGQTRELIRALKLFGLKFSFDYLSLYKQWEKEKVKNFGGAIWNSGSCSIPSSPISTKLHYRHWHCHEISVPREGDRKSLGKTVPNLSTRVFRWGNVGQSYFLKYLMNQISEILLSQYLEKYRSEIPSLDRFCVSISLGL